MTDTDRNELKSAGRPSVGYPPPPSGGSPTVQPVTRAPHCSGGVSLWMWRPDSLQPHFLHWLVLGPSVTKILKKNNFACLCCFPRILPRDSLDLEHRPLVHPPLSHREMLVSSSLPQGLAFCCTPLTNAWFFLSNCRPTFVLTGAHT